MRALDPDLVVSKEVGRQEAQKAARDLETLVVVHQAQPNHREPEVDAEATAFPVQMRFLFRLLVREFSDPS